MEKGKEIPKETEVRLSDDNVLVTENVGEAVFCHRLYITTKLQIGKGGKRGMFVTPVISIQEILGSDVVSQQDLILHDWSREGLKELGQAIIDLGEKAEKREKGKDLEKEFWAKVDEQIDLAQSE